MFTIGPCTTIINLSHNVATLVQLPNTQATYPMTKEKLDLESLALQ